MDKTLQLKIARLSEKIGNTPVLDMGDGIFGKIEGENPAGSVKDRAAFYIIVRALESGKLKAGGTVVEATSGNTGIGLAYVARELGLKALLAMPESMSLQRRQMLKAYGAEIVLTPAGEGMEGAVKQAIRICADESAFFANQFGNRASIEAHYLTTAPEFFSQVPRLKYVVSGVGSGGTAAGFGKYVKDNGIDCKIIAVEPQTSPLLSEGYAGAHKIQGIGANFVPDLIKNQKFDSIFTVSDDDAIAAAKEIFVNFGRKCGISSGAAYSAAKRLRKTCEGNIGVILPDNGERYPQELFK